MASTSTNKQPLLVDRPLFDSVRVTTQTVGSQATNTLFVQGGQAPSILVDMDAALSEDNNNCLLYTSPSPRDATLSRMPSSA